MNRGAIRLAEVFGGPQHGLQSRISRAIGVGQSVVSRWIRGDRKPDPVQRAKLEDLYGIGWRLWDQETEDDPAESGPGDSSRPTEGAA